MNQDSYKVRSACYRFTSTASVDPVACPASRVIDRVGLVDEIVERKEFVLIRCASRAISLEQQICGKQTIGQAMGRRTYGITPVLLGC